MNCRLDGEAYDRVIFPIIAPSPDDPFLQAVNRSGQPWVVILDPQDEPRLVLGTDDLLRAALFSRGRLDPAKYCHRPIIVRDPGEKLGNLIQRFRVRPRDQGDEVLEDGVILLWSARPRIMTASDLLGRLLRGIARPQLQS